MEKEKKSPQSQRLDKFRASTGYSITEFSNQCEIKSPSTLHKVISEGLTPSSKILDKVIKRFPMLNHDWVVLGYGEMIVKGLQTQETSANSLNKSNDSAYQYIIQALRDHDFALNTLSKNVEKEIVRSEHETELLKVKVNEMALALKEGQRFIREKEAQRDALIKELDKKREEKMASEFFKLSDKVHNHLNDSRNIQVNQFEKAEQNYTLEMNNKLSEGITLINKAMKKNAVDQTEYAINVFLNKINPKRLFQKVGNHTINKKD